MFETRASNQEPVSNPVRESAQGIIAAKRKTIPESPSSTDIVIPSKVRKFIIQNIGNFPIRINFESDTNSNYWELASNKSLPAPIEILDNVLMHVTSIGGTSEIQAILWG